MVTLLMKLVLKMLCMAKLQEHNSQLACVFIIDAS